MTKRAQDRAALTFRALWDEPERPRHAGGRIPNVRRSRYGREFGLTEKRVSHLSELEMDQLDACADDSIRRLLLGITETGATGYEGLYGPDKPIGDWRFRAHMGPRAPRAPRRPRKRVVAKAATVKKPPASWPDPVDRLMELAWRRFA